MHTQAFSTLIETDSVTEPTRRVLIERSTAGEDYVPRFFAMHEYATLTAVCAALAPSKTVPSYFVPSEIDKRLASGGGNGWRYSKMPADGEAYLCGLNELDRIASDEVGRDFTGVEKNDQIEILKRFRDEQVGGTIFDHRLFFEELLTELAEIFYSHPLAQEEIGYVGYADGHGWDLGVNGTNVESQRRKRELQINEDSFRENQPETPRYPGGDPVDAVIIGTGAGGAPILARLAQAGLKVVALEAGKSFNYREFPTDERAQAKLFWTDERLSAGTDPVHFGSNNSGCGVGGSTLHFTAYTPRPQADDFRLFSDFGAGRDWCLSFEDLEPYFEEIEWFLGISGVSPYPWGKPRKRGYPLTPLPLNGPAQLMRRGCERLNIRTAPAANAALSANYYHDEIGWRHTCTNRGFCQAGCSVGAKGSMDVTFLPLAERFGAEIRPESFVTEFEFDSQRKIKAVVYSQNGETTRQLCRNVFLCAGGIETPRLLLMNDLANSSGQVGRNFMAHPGVQVWGVFDDDVYPHKGIPGGLISEDTHPPQDAAFAGGYLLQSIGVMPVTYVSQLARSEQLFGDRRCGV